MEAMSHRVYQYYFPIEHSNIILLLLFIIPCLIFGQDKGNNLNKPKSPYYDYLEDVHMVNTQVAYAAGWAGTLVRTTNGGVYWDILHSQMDGQELGGIFFINETTGMAVNGQIIRTTDKGENWNIIDSGNPWYMAGISFSDENNGFAVGVNGKITHSTDGGNSWGLQQSGTDQFLWRVSAVSAIYAYAVGGNYGGQGGVIVKTSDGGTSWHSLTLPSNAGLLGVSFVDPETGTAVGSSGTIMHTTDGGASWTIQPSGTSNLLFGVSFSDAMTGTVVGSGGVILRTTNSGDSWISQNSNSTNNILSVSFANSMVGIAVGGSMTLPVILSTTDGGENWIDRSNAPLGILNDKVSPAEFRLEQNFPNPFNPSTSIQYSVPSTQWVSINIFNSIGEQIETLVSGMVTKGVHEIIFNSKNLSSGVYFYRIEAKSSSLTKKLVILK